MQLVAILYLVILLVLIGWNGFFGLLKDKTISKKQMTYLFFFKAMAIPVFYLVYTKFYGGIEGYDASVFYEDAKAVHVFSKTDFTGYLKLMFGLQDDSEGSYLYRHCLIYTHDWDNGKIRDFFYNDNRVVIRLHSLIDFIAFDSYFVHALFNCFLSFIGSVYLFKSLKEFFVGKELGLLLILCFFPTLWFYTGAVLKEGIALFVMGCCIYNLKQWVYGKISFLNFLWLIFLLFTSCFLKPYLLFSAAVCFTLFFILRRYQVRHQIFIFFGGLLVFILAANGFSLLTKHKSLLRAAFAKQRIFADAAKGGIFLLDSQKFVRLNYDSSLVKKVGAGYYTIKKDIPYMYWEHTHQEDTLFCAANRDTSTRYELVYQLRESGSNFNLNIYNGGQLKLIGSCFYYSLFYPFFYNAKGLLQLVASFENLVLLFAFFVSLWGLFAHRKDPFPAIVFITFALGLCWLVGLTTPNSGAIFRYRSPAVILILATALYYWEPMRFFARSLSLPKRKR